MSLENISQKSTPDEMRRPFISLLLVLALIVSLGLTVVSHYGISWDEEATIGVVDVNYELVTQGGENNHRQYHRQYYGTWFNVAAAALFKGQQYFDADISPDNPNALLLAEIESKHTFTFLLSIVTYVAVAGLVALLAGPAFAWIGPVVLLLIPRFWGNSFFNPKDIPLAAMFTLGTLLGAWLIGYYNGYYNTENSDSTDDREGRSESIGLNAITASSILYGIFAGIVSGTRIDSSVLMLYVMIVDVGLQLSQWRTALDIFKFFRFYTLIVSSGILTIIALYPGSWTNPLHWYLAAFNFYYKEDWPHTVLFKGASLPADNLPWDYLPTWIGITTPAIILVLFTLGLLLAALKYRGFSMGQRAGLWLVSLQVLGLPIFAIIYQATLFDTLRQVLYVLPGMAAIAAAAIAWIYQSLHRQTAKRALAGLLLALSLPIVMDMKMLHPYEYVYFNRMVGGLSVMAGQFETDYWGLSMADAVAWINQQNNHDFPLVSSDPTISANLLADEALTVVAYDDFSPDTEPFYYLALPRWDWEKRFPDCLVVYTTKRQQVPLARVKWCH